MNIPVVAAAQLSYERFVEDFVYPGRPVIVDDFAAGNQEVFLATTNDSLLGMGRPVTLVGCGRTHNATGSSTITLGP